MSRPEDADHPHAIRHRRTHFRAWHRGTREADMMIGGYFDRYGAEWSDEEFQWFDLLLEEQDVDIMAWGMGREEPPAHLSGPMMEAFRRLDFLKLVDRDADFRN